MSLEGTVLPAEAYVDASGRTMVPLRFVSESLGFTVTWEAKTRQATIRGAGREVCLQIGQSRAVVDGREKRLDTVPVIYRDRTMVPLRFVAETFGLEVDWEGSTRTVLLSRPKEDPSRPA
ncbi:MAG: copper amine oxidase N-terminal domain-containing protein, partial [Clostridia bacterium]|nr:copper amine oxidase N-terminal domain-containing protein [Clostridia bacterium]